MSRTYQLFNLIVKDIQNNIYVQCKCNYLACTHNWYTSKANFETPMKAKRVY